jgi:hypothetical protein
VKRYLVAWRTGHACVLQVVRSRARGALVADSIEGSYELEVEVSTSFEERELADCKLGDCCPCRRIAAQSATILCYPVETHRESPLEEALGRSLFAKLLHTMSCI